MAIRGGLSDTLEKFRSARRPGAGSYPLIRSNNRLGSFSNAEEGYKLLASDVIGGRRAKADKLRAALRGSRDDLLRLLAIADRVFLASHQRADFMLALSHMLQAQAGQPKRLNGTTYASHPIRVTNTLLAVYGVSNLDSARTTIFHDSIENDHLGLAIATGELEEDEGFDCADITEIREIALEGLKEHHGTRLSEAVEAISSPDHRAKAKKDLPEGTDEEIRELRRQYYYDFIRDSVIKNDYSLLGKCPDVGDNGTSLDGLSIAAQIRRCRKYLPAIDILLIPAIRESDSDIIEGCREIVLAELEKLSTALRERLERLGGTI